MKCLLVNPLLLQILQDSQSTRQSKVFALEFAFTYKLIKPFSSQHCHADLDTKDHCADILIFQNYSRLSGCLLTVFWRPLIVYKQGLMFAQALLFSSTAPVRHRNKGFACTHRRLRWDTNTCRILLSLVISNTATRRTDECFLVPPEMG